MLPEAESLLFDVLAAGRNAILFVNGLSFEEYKENVLVRAGVERMLFVVGEAIVQLRAKDHATFELLTDAENIIGFRNLLAHGYNRIDDSRLWLILKESLPATLSEIELLLGEI